MSLNAEPAAPEERETHHLPPKSYAEAAEAPAESQIYYPSETNDSGGPEDSKPRPLTPLNGINGNQHRDENGDHEKSYAEVLEAPPRPQDAPTSHLHNWALDHSPAVTEQSNGTAKSTPPPIAPEKEQYEGSGQDDSPKSPKKGHKRHSSLNSNGSTPSRPSSRSKHQIYHEHNNGNGGLLASVKPTEDYDHNLAAKKGKPHKKGQLVHGKQAGAGWTKSKYATPTHFHEHMDPHTSSSDEHRQKP
jgi:2-acylglycerol O-acyltransferase 2